MSSEWWKHDFPSELESERKLRENMDAPAKRAAKKTIKINIEKNADIAFWITAKT